jgi:formylglycine-generating enzyme required for sulfatase activity
MRFNSTSISRPLAALLRAAALNGVVLAMLASGCNAETANPKTANSKAADDSAAAMSAEQIKKLKANAEVKALLDKTLKNMRFVEGGSFEMGDFGPKHSPDKLYYSSAEDNKPPWKVTLDSFSMSAFKTSYEDYDVFSRAMGKALIAQDKLSLKSRFAKAAAGVNWYQAREYCQWLGTLLELPIDLPTEAQWEYAARNRGQYFLVATDNGKVDAGRNVWEFDQRNAAVQKLEEESGRNVGVPPSLPLGQFPATPLGLYDMATDGYEWMLDWYNVKQYEQKPATNPKGPSSGEQKVLRSFPSSAGSFLAVGNGLTITRHKRNPSPQGETWRGEPDPAVNANRETAARCVLNRAAKFTGP